MAPKYFDGPAIGQDMQDEWEAKWADPVYSPPWLSNEPPEELKRAILNGRFPKQGSILDIGCGTGNMSA